MKIAQFVASKGDGGVERSFVELCNELSKKHQIRAIVFKDFPLKKRLAKNVEIVELQGSSRYNPFVYMQLLRLLKDVDIIHTHAVKATQMIVFLKRFLDIPFVATKRNSRVSRKKIKYFSKANIAVGVSKKVTDQIINKNKKTIYDGIVPKNIVTKKEDVFTMISIGRLDRVKGFKELIEAVAKLDFEYRLWIVGDGEEREELLRVIKNLNLEQKVILLGHREDIPELMAKAHLQVINSYNEGFSRVLIEGLFYSDLIISTKVSGSVEVLMKEFLYEMEELSQKIEEIYRNYKYYKQLFLPIKQKSDLFRLERTAVEYEILYSSLLENRL